MGGEELKIGSLDISFTEFGHEGKWKIGSNYQKGSVYLFLRWELQFEKPSAKRTSFDTITKIWIKIDIKLNLKMVINFAKSDNEIEIMLF